VLGVWLGFDIVSYQQQDKRHLQLASRMRQTEAGGRSY
jgi:hypothetical protein